MSWLLSAEVIFLTWQTPYRNPWSWSAAARVAGDSAPVDMTLQVWGSSSTPYLLTHHWVNLTTLYVYHADLVYSFGLREGNVTTHEKPRYELKIAVLDNVHLKVQTLCYFKLKSDLPNGDKITSVWNNAILFSVLYSSLFILISYAET